MSVEQDWASREPFDALAEQHRHEILLHCYRMLGSIHDAEDAVQDTLLRAWRSRDQFDGRGTFRGWLYRIATNACLRSLERRGRVRRLLPDEAGPSTSFEPLGTPDRQTAWLEPLPTTRVADVIDVEPGPEARYEAREATRLAFVVAIQHLPPRQRAVLMLRDVVGLSAAETASVLVTSTAAVNSLLQRARAGLARRPPDAATGDGQIDEARQRAVLDRYVSTWEAGDIDGFVALLAEDAIWTMPPWRQWFRGREPIGAFMAWVRDPGRGRHARLIATSANGQPAFGYYRTEPGGSLAMPFAIQVLDIRPTGIGTVVNFVDATLFPLFDLPPSVKVRSPR